MLLLLIVKVTSAALPGLIVMPPPTTCGSFAGVGLMVFLLEAGVVEPVALALEGCLEWLAFVLVNALLVALTGIEPVPLFRILIPSSAVPGSGVKSLVAI